MMTLPQKPTSLPCPSNPPSLAINPANHADMRTTRLYDKRDGLFGGRRSSGLYTHLRKPYIKRSTTAFSHQADRTGLH